ncbi:ATP-dependent helicase [Patescibacteria group bacterium]|nr:ATP-dependent helicase [Patescibacteria group bacterium]
MLEGIFEKEYKTLNPAQKIAVDSIDGPVMVVAGPGTGKTTILTLRIAKILRKTDTNPENILALTFTEAASINMRRKLSEIIGSRAYQVTISTFHSFAESIIRKYPEEFPRIIGSRPIGEVDQVSIIESLIDSSSLKILRPYGDPYLYTKDISSNISTLKREGLSPEEFLELIKEEEINFKKIPNLYHEKGVYKGKMKGEYQKLEKIIEKNRELYDVYKAYQEELFKNKFYDFSDMIMEVLQAIDKSKFLLQVLQEEYQYILVDEHQDTNNAQNKIIERLSSYHAPNPNLFVVGDEKQAIFRFQGASLENFLYFKNLYKNAKLITLSENYRSTQKILDLVHGLMPDSIRLNSSAKHKLEKIFVYPFETPESEAYFIVEDIKKRISGGTVPEEIAVLYRNNKDAFAISNLMKKVGVPHQIESDLDLFSDGDVKKLLTILRAINNFGNERAMVEFLHINLFKVEPLDVYRLLKSVDLKKKFSLFDMLTKLDSFKDLELQNRKAINDAFKQLSGWVKESKNSDLLSIFETVVRESELLKSILESSNTERKFDAISSFFDEAKNLVLRKPDANLEDFFTYIETVKKHNLFINKKSTHKNKGMVRLMTVHRAKGLEFEYVYIIRAYSGHFGDKRSLDKLKLLPRIYMLSDKTIETITDENADERRLFYVALTRAKIGISITYSKKDDDGKELLPSSFIGELKPELIEICDTSSQEKEYQKNREIIFKPELREADNLKDKDFVRELFSLQGFSPTALNNYLECPWKYFYQNLIRIPSAPTKYQAYGTAIHRALSDFFRRMKEEETGKKFLLKSFEGYLNSSGLRDRDTVELLEKGGKALSLWHDVYNKNWNENVLTEFRINGIILDKNIRLTGILDKIEFVDGNVVNVVDYKTGKSKTRNELLGKTKNADGNYFRQLVFYKILLDRFEDGKFQMQSGIIDFIEPDEKEKLHKEIFEISKKDTEELVEKIKQVVNEIFNLSFWNTRCGNKDCEFCSLRDMMR